MEQVIAKYVLVFGLMIILSIFIKYGFKLIQLPAIAGYFLLGVILHNVNQQWVILETEGIAILEFLANIGIIAMLLKIGMESKISKLLKWLPRATIIWIGDIALSGSLAFLTAYYLLDWGLIPALFIGTAFTATSVGISVGIWDDLGAIDTQSGQTLLDVAELDDLSGILLMGILFSVAPIIHQGVTHSIGLEVISATGWFLAKLVLVVCMCLLFSRYLAEELIELLNRMHGHKGSIMVVVGVGLIVAALTGLMGFSFAIGAFFIGIMLSENPTKIKLDTSFDAIHNLFVPFFFISIGFAVSLSSVSIVWTSLILLLVVAILGKFLGAGLGTWVTLGFTYSGVIGLSMIPRAEIFLIILKRGYELGTWAVTDEIFTYSVIISAVTALAVPVVLRDVLQRKQNQLQKI